MKKKVRFKKSVKGKLVLFSVLAVLMAALITGELFVRGKAPTEQTPLTTEAPQPATESTSESTDAPPTTEAVPETTTEAVPQTNTEPTSAVALATPAAPVTVDPTGENWALTLVNLSHRLPDKYVPSLANAITGSTVQLDARIAAFYQRMYDAAKSDGCILTPYAGYCSFARQNENYTRKVNYFVNQGLSQEQAQARTNTTILPAGCSEHNLGLSMDIVTASTDFASTKEFRWLTENAHTYGFVLRYPSDKADITGVSYQPWHWRYVGEDAAKKMKSDNLCLEEYSAAQ